MDVLKTVKVTSWYKAISVVFGTAFIIALIAQRDSLTMVFAGVFLVGVGEWKNHDRKSFELRPSVGGWAKVADVPRRTTILGTVMQLSGGLLIALGVAHAFGLRLPPWS